jgi:hypothetical protein
MADDLSWFDPRDLRRFYSGLIAHGWRHLIPLLDRLDDILAMRDKLGLFTFTSHEVLCFTRHPEFPAWSHDDLVAIDPLANGKVELTFFVYHLRTREKEVVDYEQLLSALQVALPRLANERNA